MSAISSCDPVLFFIYLFYGAVFFAVGVAITSRHKTIAKLKIAGAFELFSCFAFLHAFHEWFELFLKMGIMDEAGPLITVAAFNLLLVSLSFLFLFIFGAHLIEILHPGSRIFLFGLGLFLTVVFIVYLYENPARDRLQFMGIIDFGIRRSLGFPATIITGIAFLLYSRQLKLLSRRGAGNFFGAGIALFVYGVLTGLVPSTTPLVAGVPVEFFRGLAALAMLHFIMYGLDLFDTEREEMVARRLRGAARAERLSALGRLAAGIAHEINNPLATVSLQLELLGRDLDHQDVPEQTLLRLRAIEENVDKTATIARELLLVARDRSVELRFETCALKRIIENAWRLITPQAEHVCLEVNQTVDRLAVRGAPLKLEELFINLFLNAVDAMSGRGVITVKGRVGNNGIFLSVRDHGRGIDLEKLDLVSEPFFTTKEVGAGTGLGLSICHSIMESHGGSMELTSRPGRGTTVILRFPEA